MIFSHIFVLTVLNHWNMPIYTCIYFYFLNSFNVSKEEESGITINPKQSAKDFNLFSNGQGMR